jgi:RING finger protein 113A
MTGSCGFGDNCKYLHSREVYKAGWALDRDWEIQTKGKKQKGTIVASRRGKPDADDGGVTEEEAKMLEKIPFACTICKRPYVKPIVTTCGHYFCEACALQRFRKTPNCESCGSGTGGVFNMAKNLQKLLDRKRIREEKLQEKELEGIDSDDDDE